MVFRVCHAKGDAMAWTHISECKKCKYFDGERCTWEAGVILKKVRCVRCGRETEAPLEPAMCDECINELVGLIDAMYDKGLKQVEVVN
jgi:hypothetical protein